MSTSKSLAWAQVGIITASLIISIMMMIHLGKGGVLSFGEAAGLLSGSLCVSLTGFILGIMQIVYSTKDKDNTLVVVVAGICGILIFIPFMEILSLGANFLIITEEPLNN